MSKPLNTIFYICVCLGMCMYSLLWRELFVLTSSLPPPVRMFYFSKLSFYIKVRDCHIFHRHYF